MTTQHVLYLKKHNEKHSDHIHPLWKDQDCKQVIVLQSDVINNKDI